MGYIGRKMSVNADAAYKKGLLTRTKFTKKILEQNGWKYSVSFFRWLCKDGYIVPLEYHHTTPVIKCTPFYSLDTISYVVAKYDLESLYDVYLKRCTMRDILRRKGVQHVKILVSRTIMGTSTDIYLDCLQYNKLYWWSKNLCLKVDSNNVALIMTFELENFTDWHNPNRESVERQICIRKNYYRKPLN